MPYKYIFKKMQGNLLAGHERREKFFYGSSDPAATAGSRQAFDPDSFSRSPLPC
jgi:hypothetical protein